MPTTCGSCGAPLLPTMRFCTSCGAPNPSFQDPAAPGAAQATPPAEQPASPDPGLQDLGTHDPGTQVSPQAFDPAPPTTPFQAPPTAPYQAQQPQPFGQAPQQYGQPEQGQFEQGQYGQGQAEQAPVTQAPHEQGQYAPAPFGQPSFAQGQYEQGQYEQGQYGQAPGAASQPPFGQPSQPNQQQPTAWEQPATPKKSKKGVLAVIALLVLLLAGSGAGIWWFLLRDDSSSASSSSASAYSSDRLPAPLAEEPEQAWSWPVVGSYYINRVGNYVAVTSDEGVQLFGTSDQPLWTNDDVTSIRSEETPDGKVWGYHSETKTAALIDLKTGKTESTYEGWSPWFAGDSGNTILVKYDDDSYEVTDAKAVDADGKDVYDLPDFTTFDTDGDNLYLADKSGTLTSIDAADGKENWEIEIPSWEIDTEVPVPAGPQMAFLEGDDFFLATEDGLTMRAKSDGKAQSNDKTDDLECGRISAVAPFMAMCLPESASDSPTEPEPQEATFFDATGVKGKLTVERPYFGAVQQGEDWYLVNSSDNTVYDTSFEKVGQLAVDSDDSSSDIAYTNNGAYVLGDELELKDMKGDATWSVEVPAGTGENDKSYLNRVVGTDDMIVVLKDGVITAWKK